MWLEVLRMHVTRKGARACAKELGLSRPTVDLVLKGTYQASTARVEARVKNVYGRDGYVDCNAMGSIEPIVCAENFRRAKAIGMRAGNPETLRLYSACLRCHVRLGR